MKNYAYKMTFILCFGFFLISQHKVYGQEKPDYINLNDILVKLTFTSRISHTTEEINTQLIKEIRRRKIGFALSFEGEKWIRDAGGSDSLITEVRANTPKDIQRKPEYIKFTDEADALYEKFKENYRGDIKQKEIAIKTAEEFIKRYGDEKNIKEEFREHFKEDFKDIIQFLKGQIPKLEQSMPCRLE